MHHGYFLVVVQLWLVVRPTQLICIFDKYKRHSGQSANQWSPGPDRYSLPESYPNSFLLTKPNPKIISTIIFKKARQKGQTLKVKSIPVQFVFQIHEELLSGLLLSKQLLNASYQKNYISCHVALKTPSKTVNTQLKVFNL